MAVKFYFNDFYSTFPHPCQKPCETKIYGLIITCNKKMLVTGSKNGFLNLSLLRWDCQQKKKHGTIYWSLNLLESEALMVSFEIGFIFYSLQYFFLVEISMELGWNSKCCYFKDTNCEKFEGNVLRCHCCKI